jgi:MFS transporter, DHA3 family, tetracycline resistance protein
VSTQFDTADARSESGVAQPVESAGGWRVLAPFRFREYRLLIAAVSISIFTEGMWSVVMALQVIALDNDPASLSLVATCVGIGLVAFLLVGRPRRRPAQPAQHHHRGRDRQRDRGIDSGGAGFDWHT